MILFVTSRGDATADYLGSNLKKKGVAFTRINTDDIVSKLSIEWSSEIVGPVMAYENKIITTAEVSGVWFRRPKAVKFGAYRSPEARHAALEFSTAFESVLEFIPRERWINHPAANVLASHKMEQLKRAKSFGISVPESIITQSPEVAANFLNKMGAGAITKPLASGYINRKNPIEDSLIYTSRVTRHNTRPKDLELVRACPTLFQKEIQKKADVRITVIDNHVHAVLLNATDGSRQRLDIRRDEMVDVKYALTEIPRHLSLKLIKLLRSYGLRFAAVDMCIDKRGRWHFLEINPNGQWAWLDLSAVTDIASSLSLALLSPATLNNENI